VDATQLAVEAAPKAVVYAAAVVALGLASTRLLVARAATELGGELDAIVRAVLLRLFAGAAALLLAGTLARLVGHTLAAFGPGDGLTLDALRTIGLESRWGSGWRVQMLAAAALLVTAPALGAAFPWWPLPALAALAAGAAVPILGHGAESTGATLLHATHLVASGLWLGTLMALLLLEWRVRRGYGVTAARRLTQALVPRFSPLAVFTSSVVIVSGVVAVLDYVPSPAALVDTTYGRALVVKLLLVGVVGSCGFANWQAVLAGRVPARGLMRAEALAALAIVAVTAVLTEAEPPTGP
jgi:putative copper export protein